MSAEGSFNQKPLASGEIRGAIWRYSVMKLPSNNFKNNANRLARRSVRPNPVKLRGENFVWSVRSSRTPHRPTQFQPELPFFSFLQYFQFFPCLPRFTNKCLAFVCLRPPSPPHPTPPHPPHPPVLFSTVRYCSVLFSIVENVQYVQYVQYCSVLFSTVQCRTVCTVCTVCTLLYSMYSTVRYCTVCTWERPLNGNAH